MRTTLNLEEEAIKEIQILAEQENISRGDAASFLIKRAVELSKPRIETVDGLPCIVRPPGTRKYSQEELQKWIDADPIF